jgi:hypothetical protein
MGVNAHHIAAIALGLTLTACAGQGEPFGPTGIQQLGYAEPPETLVTGSEASVSPFQWAPPNYAGMLGARLVKNPDGTLVAEIIDGKERGGASVALPFGTEPGSPMLTFSSTDSKAFIGQQVRAAVEAEIVKEYGLTIRQLSGDTRALVEKVVEVAVCAATGGVGCIGGAASGLLE